MILAGPLKMESHQSPFFRLPNELRYQIYSDVFFSHIRDPPLLRKKTLERPQKYERCIRLWIEGEDLLTHRNWLNEITTEPRTDIHAFLRTCKAAYEDAGSFIHDNTLFMVFTSTKYTRLFEKTHPKADMLPDSVERKIDILTPRPVIFYSYRERSPVDNKPRWKLCWGGHGYEFRDPGTTFLGHLNSRQTSFLRRVRNVHVFANIKTPQMMHLTSTKLRNLRTSLPATVAEMKTSKIEIQLMDPSRGHVEKKLWRSEPLVSRDTFETFLATIQRFEAYRANDCFVDHWWRIALRKPRLVALEDAWYGKGNTAAYRRSERMYPWDRELIDKWNVPWCGECSYCKERAQRVEGLDQMPGIDVCEEAN